MRLLEVARRLMLWCAGATLAWTTCVQAGDITISGSAAEFPLEDTEVAMKLVVANSDTESSEVRMRPPYVARLDETRRTFEPLHDVESLRIQMNRLELSLAPGEQQEIEVQIERRAPMPAGRYKLLFTAEDAGTGRRRGTGAIFLVIPARIELGEPEVTILEAASDSDRISAMVRFNMQSNVRSLKAAVMVGDLQYQRDDGVAYRLPLDSVHGVEIVSRGELRPNSVHVAFVSTADTDTGPARRSEWARLSAPGDEPLYEDLYVELQWRNDRRQPLPAGTYQGQVKLLLIPTPEP